MCEPYRGIAFSPPSFDKNTLCSPSLLPVVAAFVYERDKGLDGRLGEAEESPSIALCKTSLELLDTSHFPLLSLGLSGEPTKQRDWWQWRWAISGSTVPQHPGGSFLLPIRKLGSMGGAEKRPRARDTGRCCKECCGIILCRGNPSALTLSRARAFASC